MPLVPKTLDGITKFQTLQQANEFACDDDWIESNPDGTWQVVTPTSMRGQKLRDRTNAFFSYKVLNS